MRHRFAPVSRVAQSVQMGKGDGKMKVSVRNLIGYAPGHVEIMDAAGTWRAVQEAKRTSKAHVSVLLVGDSEWREYADTDSCEARETAGRPVSALPAHDTRACIEEGRHLLFNRHTASECPVETEPPCPGKQNGSALPASVGWCLGTGNGEHRYVCVACGAPQSSV